MAFFFAVLKNLSASSTDGSSGDDDSTGDKRNNDDGDDSSHSDDGDDDSTKLRLEPLPNAIAPTTPNVAAIFPKVRMIVSSLVVSLTRN